MSYPSSADTVGLPSPKSLAIHLDLVGGLAGDMFVAALVDAFPALAAPVLAELAAVQPRGGPAPGFRVTSTGGLRAQGFGLLPQSARANRLDSSDKTRARAGAPHAHENPGTPYRTLRGRLVEAPLSPATREHALALLALLADAEARVHGVAVDAVHFHELADWDSLLDVVAAGCIAARLDGAHWSASTLPLGGGTVRTAHGVLPVPAPATSVLLAGYAWHDDGIAGERVTPTGAAILRHLVPAARCGGPRDAGRLLATGCGAGTRKIAGMPNIVRALVVERASAATADTDGDVVSVLEFDVDDMTGEEIAVAADRLRAEAGVLDVSVGTRHGKKGRPLADFRLLARPEASEAIARACLTETSTLGLRLREERRRVLRRTDVATEVTSPLGDLAIEVKVAERPGGGRTAKAAHDDVVATHGHGERRRIRATAVRRALKGAEE